MARTVSKLNPAWVTQARNHFLKFLKVTQCPHPERNGLRGRKFMYPEWLVMFMAVLSVKCKVKSYLAIHRMSTQYWDATWGYAHADGWVYGHSAFSLVSHQTPVLGLFQWMPNCAHEAKRLQAEIVQCTGLVKTVCMDSKADDQKLYALLKHQHRMQLLTAPRRGMDKSPARQQMIREMRTPPHRKTYKQRATTVEPRQGLVKELFELDTCWRRGDESQRWLFAAMGIAVQRAQRRAYRRATSTWNIKEEVIGV